MPFFGEIYPIRINLILVVLLGGRLSMIRRKILLAGVFLILCASCFPYTGLLSGKLPSETSSAGEEAPSLFTQAELEQLFSQGTGPAQTEPPTLTSSQLQAESFAFSLEHPISDGCNDDFNLEIFPEDQRRSEPDFDIPIVINARVEQFIQYFQTTCKSRFSNWLARSEKYIPMMKTLLKENGLPEDLVYLALIESGFNPYAYSRSKASGPWQFIYFTGKRYGLEVNWWVDERRDPEKSTVAAAKYLKDLYDMFECWYLAAAGYNAGEGKIITAMKRYRTEDFWELAKTRYLKQETKDYVPQMIAAALIAKDPEQYGFVGIEYQGPLCYEKVKVPEVTDLGLIARACEISEEELKDLNPELLRGCTPPNVPEYEVKIPCGKKELFLRNFETHQPAHRFQFKTHIVKKGETLARIVRAYRVETEPLLEINGLKKNSRLSGGMNLLIPIPLQDPKATSVTKSAIAEKGRDNQPKEITYTIKKGDTLWSIANEMGVNIGVLSRWNNLHPERKLVPGDKLKIRIHETPSTSVKKPPRKKEPKEIVYKVKGGDTLSGIAERYHVSVSEIQAWNQLRGVNRIHPEDLLKLKLGRSDL